MFSTQATTVRWAGIHLRARTSLFHDNPLIAIQQNAVLLGETLMPLDERFAPITVQLNRLDEPKDVIANCRPHPVVAHQHTARLEQTPAMLEF